MESNCNTISIHLYQPKGSLKHVWINNKTPIKVFQAFYHQQIKCFISGGNILDENQTFSQLGLSNDALIIVILKNEYSDSFQDKWLKQSSKTDLFTSEMKILINPNNRKEVCRLKDLRLIKLENKPIRQRHKLNSRIQDQKLLDEPVKIPDDLKISYDSTIQESPLPFLFS